MLRVSEHFYSIQAEGASVGVPAYFIRLAGCNLMCGGSGGSLVKEGKATWWCDSERLWRQSMEMVNENLEQSFIDLGILKRILDGHLHLVWTGGEPTLLKNRNSIIDFLMYMGEKYPYTTLYNEIETNGTIVVDDDFYTGYIDQINCSPKLANSGIPENIRIVPEAIGNVNNHPNGYFKFVISTEDDMKEIQDTFIKPFDIPSKKVIIMPGVDNSNDLPERTRFLFDMSKKYGYRGITRQQILAWGKREGV